MFKFTITLEMGRPSKNKSKHLTRESWARVRNLVKKRDNATCQYCGKNASDGEADHVLPLSRGGTDAMTNLVWACETCNRSKGSKPPREWLTSTKEHVAELPYPEIISRPNDGGVIIL